jgi:hypothetical protein
MKLWIYRYGLILLLISFAAILSYCAPKKSLDVPHPSRLRGVCTDDQIARSSETHDVHRKSSETHDVHIEHINTELDEVREWLWNHPPDGTNRSERRKRIHFLQEVCETLPSSTYREYMSAWNGTKKKADALEREHPALYYLRTAIVHAIQNIRQTRVKRGLALWYVYNMGYVFKTPETCFGIDLHGRDVELLANDLDFLLITHNHKDHYSEPLLKAMIAAKKPVITRWYPDSILVKHPDEFRFGTVRVKVDIGDHWRYVPLLMKNTMLMFQIDCGETTNHCTIYHSGDNSTLKKMRPDRPVDLLFLHVHVLGMPVETVIRHLSPRKTFVSHVMELHHPSTSPIIRRWSYDYAFKRMQDISEAEASVLTWGERWLVPGTVLETAKFIHFFLASSQLK